MCIVGSVWGATKIFPTPTITHILTPVATLTYLTTIKLKTCELIKSGKGMRPKLPAFIYDYAQTLNYKYVTPEEKISRNNVDATCVYIYIIMRDDKVKTTSQQAYFLKQCKANDIQVINDFAYEIEAREMVLK